MNKFPTAIVHALIRLVHIAILIGFFLILLTGSINGKNSVTRRKTSFQIDCDSEKNICTVVDENHFSQYSKDPLGILKIPDEKISDLPWQIRFAIKLLPLQYIDYCTEINKEGNTYDAFTLEVELKNSQKKSIEMKSENKVCIPLPIESGSVVSIKSVNDRQFILSQEFLQKFGEVSSQSLKTNRVSSSDEALANYNFELKSYYERRYFSLLLLLITLIVFCIFPFYEAKMGILINHYFDDFLRALHKKPRKYD